MLNYILLFIAAFLFSTQFMVNKYYQKEMGTGLFTSCLFIIINQVSLFIIIFIINGFKLEVNWFTIIVSLVFAITSVLCTVFGIKSMGAVNLSVYSLFLMLGGMLVPFIYGVIIGETINLLRILGCIVVIAALLLSLNKDGKTSKFGFLCCMIIFITNGLVGVIQNYYVSNSLALSDNDFMFFRAAMTAFLAGLIFIYELGVKKEKVVLPEEKNKKIKTLIMPILMTVVNGTASAIMLVAAHNVPASVQYPIITGGCVFLAVIWDTVFGVKITKKSILQAVIVLIGTILFMLS